MSSNRKKDNFQPIVKHSISPWIYVILGGAIFLACYVFSVVFLYPQANVMNFAEYLQIGLKEHSWKLWTYYNEKTIPCLGIGLIAWIFLCYYISYNFRNYQTGKEYGVADWADPYEVTKRRANPDDRWNRYLTRNLSIDTQGDGKPSNNNMIILGASGSMKTTSVVTPNILHGSSNLIIMDVKGELKFKYGLWLQEHGYDVRVLDLENPDQSDRYNPFSYVEDEDDLLYLITALYDSLTPEQPTAEDPFWPEGTKFWLMSVFFYEWWDARFGGSEPRNPSINNVMSLINEESQFVDPGRPLKPGERPISVLQQKMNALAKNPKNKEGENNPAVRYYRKVKEGAEETVRSIKIIANSKLKYLETPSLHRIFSGVDEMKLRDFATGVGGSITKRSDGTYEKHLTDKKVALFICVPKNNNNYHFVASMLYTQAIMINCRIADNAFRETGGALPIPLELWMDEFYKGARPYDVTGLFGITRSNNISLIPVLQSRAQLEDLFGDSKAKTIFDNVSTLIFLGAGRAAEDTQKWISEMIGQMTADKASDSKNGMNISASHDRVGVSLLTQQQVGKMPLSDAIVFLEEEDPIYDRKRMPWEDPKFSDKKIEKLKEKAKRKGKPYVSPESHYYEALRLNKENEKYHGYVHFVKIRTDMNGVQHTITGKENTKPIEILDSVPEGVHSYKINVDDFLRMDFSEEDALERAARAFPRIVPKGQLEKEPSNSVDQIISQLKGNKKNPVSESDTKKVSEDSFSDLLQKKRKGLSDQRKKILSAAMMDGRSEEELKFLLNADDNNLRNYLMLNPLKVSSTG